jgi:hypothetical protein
MRLSLIRPPFSYKYHCLDVREESILTYLLGAISEEPGVQTTVHDFHLQRDLTLDACLTSDPEVVVVPIRESAEAVHYARRVAMAVRACSGARILLYGQVGRLEHLNRLPDGTLIVRHSEALLKQALGLSKSGSSFSDGLKALPYFRSLPLKPWQSLRFKASIETSRGCQFGCRFCFINSGSNYEQRWSVRPVDDIMRDVATYRRCGVHNFVFYDSEFLGKDPHNRDRCRLLLQRLREEADGVSIKLYCRADTLEEFAEYALLAAAGVKQVFVGVESFDDNDLAMLNKQITSDVLKRCITNLAQVGIYTSPSFIVFNRATTIDSLRRNLDHISTLLSSCGRFLGMPTFCFSFETGWRPNTNQKTGPPLSKATYIGHDLNQKEQPSPAPVFDVRFEPLMEMYRLLSYEWSKKVTELNLALDTASLPDSRSIQTWLDRLPSFCLSVMKDALEAFASNELNMTTLEEQTKALFDSIRTFNQNLPQRFSSLSTYSSHGSHIDYRSECSILEEDEYWSAQIPGMPT